MSFRIELDRYERAYGHFIAKIQMAIQKTFAEEEESRDLTQVEMARELNVDPSVVSRRLSGGGNITLRTISDLYTAMGREPLSNFVSTPSCEAINKQNFQLTGTTNVYFVVLHGPQSGNMNLDPYSVFAGAVPNNTQKEVLTYAGSGRSFWGKCIGVGGSYVTPGHEPFGTGGVEEVHRYLPLPHNRETA